MTPLSDDPGRDTGTQATVPRSALRAAEDFLAGTAETITPETPARELLRYAGLYRSHLAALVAAARPMKTPVRARSLTSQRARTGPKET
jgi:hypothetical protein